MARQPAKPKAATKAEPKQAKPKAAAAKPKAPAKPRVRKSRAVPGAVQGAPSTFTDALAEEICLKLSLGKTLTDILKADGMPDHSTVIKWTKARPEFGQAYAHAREEQMHAWADEIISLADDSGDDFKTATKPNGSTFEKFDREHVQRVTLRIDTRKWLMARLARTTYGDNQKIDLTATIESKDDNELLHELEQAAGALGVSVADLMATITVKKA